MAEPRRLSIEAIKGKLDLREVEAVEWPGRPGRMVGIMQLRCDELADAYFAAREAFSRRGLETIDDAREAFGAELALQYTARMLVAPDARTPKGRIFTSADEARRSLDPDERAYFCDRHSEGQERRATKWTEQAARARLERLRAEVAELTEALGEDREHPADADAEEPTA